MKQLNEELNHKFEKYRKILLNQYNIGNQSNNIKIGSNDELKEKGKTGEKYIDKLVINENADNRLYYFRFIFRNKKYYKIGITSQSLEERYGKDFVKIDKILFNERIDGAIKIEKEIKLKFKENIFPLAYLNGGGHTETFDKDVLDLDTSN